ncbi:MAG: HD domain-containing protein, partial [Acidobacteriota bacterium]
MIKPLSRAGKVAFTLVNLAGIVTYSWVAYHVLTTELSTLSLQYVLLFLLTIGGGWISVKIPGLNSLISLSDAFVFSAVLFFGPFPAVLIAGADGFIATRRHTGRLLSAFTSLSVMSISVAVAGVIYQSLLPMFWDPVEGHPRLDQLITPLGAMALVHYLLNSSLVATLTALARRMSIFRTWMESYVWTSMSFFAGAGAAGLTYVLLRQLGWAVAIVFLPIVLITYASYRIYLDRIESQNRHIAAMNRVHLQTIEALAMSIDAKGQSTQGHLRRVQAYAVGLAELVGVEEETLEAIRAAALLHDVGKLAVPDYIINKPGPLSAAERKKVETYPRIGAEILSKVDFPYPVVPIIRHHRERWDGSGYPDGLAGEQIPLGARIINLADCADAMRSPRPWRSPLSNQETLRSLENKSGSDFDPNLVALFCDNLDTLDARAEAVELPQQGGIEEISAILREHTASLYERRGSSDVLGDIVAARKEALALYDLAKDLSSSLDLDETLRVIMNKLRSLIAFDTGVVFLFDEKSGLILPALVDGHNEKMLRRKTLRRGEGITGWAVENVRTVINAQPELDFYGNELAVGRMYQSAAVVPLVGGGLCLGTITLYDGRARHFSIEDERILDLVGPQAAAAIQNARSYAETRSRAMTDLLTGLPNSRCLYSEIGAQMSEAHRRGRA